MTLPVALGGWLAGMTLSALSVFLLTWAGLALLHIPLALLSALVCGLLTFVPTIGPTAATLLPVAVALLVSPTAVLSPGLLDEIDQPTAIALLTRAQPERPRGAWEALRLGRGRPALPAARGA